MSSPAAQVINFKEKIGADKKLRELSANELVFAVVGPVGSGTSWVAKALSGLLVNTAYSMDVHIIKASEVIVKWAGETKTQSIDSSSTFNKVTSLQNAGDEMRRSDPAAVGVALVSAIKNKRDSLQAGQNSVTAIKPVDAVKRRAYILDSLKHPAEVELLRAVYQDALCLIGVVCEESIREKRLIDKKCQNTGKIDIKSLMKRDEDAEVKHGQKVTDTFHLADFFIDNSPDRYEDDEKKIPNPLWDVSEQLARLVDLITFGKIIRPTPSETGMFQAYGAKMQSACLSRQVGAALLDSKGNIVSTGTNEVPRAGGGVYGGSFYDYDDPENFSDHRCATTNRYCSSNRNQDEIINIIIDSIPQLRVTDDKVELAKQLKKTPIGKLLEFSRAVHAEMDALLSAARTGATTVGTRLFVTTYPCHYCARHIVSAGVDEVQYIEPYPKSRAITLHGDAITSSPGNWTAPSIANFTMVNGKKMKSKVLFRPFTGVAPRLYRQVFLKNRKLKDDAGNFIIGDSDSASGLLRLSYKDVEEALLADKQEE